MTRRRVKRVLARLFFAAALCLPVAAALGAEGDRVDAEGTVIGRDVLVPIGAALAVTGPLTVGVWLVAKRDARLDVVEAKIVTIEQRQTVDEAWRRSVDHKLTLLCQHAGIADDGGRGVG